MKNSLLQNSQRRSNESDIDSGGRGSQVRAQRNQDYISDTLEAALTNLNEAIQIPPTLFQMRRDITIIGGRAEAPQHETPSVRSGPHKDRVRSLLYVVVRCGRNRAEVQIRVV